MDEGTLVGGAVGIEDGSVVGRPVGGQVSNVGASEGFPVGVADGTEVGSELGTAVGREDGTDEGSKLGTAVGAGVCAATAPSTTAIRSGLAPEAAPILCLMLHEAAA